MAESSVAITAGSGTAIDTFTQSGGANRQAVVIGDPTAANAAAVSAAGALSVAIAASQGTVATVAGTISASNTNTPGTAVTASTTGQVVAAVGSSGNTTIALVTSAFNGTLQFEASLDAGLNYGPVMSVREDGTGAESAAAISTAVAFIRLYTTGVPGFAYFRVRCTAFTSGSVAVSIAQGPSLIETNPSLAASGALIGQVTLAAGANTFGILGSGTNNVGAVGGRVPTTNAYIANQVDNNGAQAAFPGAALTVGTTGMTVFQDRVVQASAVVNSGVPATLQAAPAAGLSLYVRDIVIANSGSTGTLFELTNGLVSATTPSFSIFVGAGATVTAALAVPLKFSAATALGYYTSAATTTLYINVRGYTAP